MKLARLSSVSIASCAAGLAALVSIGLMAHGDMRAKQAEMAGLIELQNLLDSLSAESDRLVLSGGDAETAAAFRSEAASLQRQLRAIGDEYPTARTARLEIDRLIEALEDANALPTEPAGEPSDSRTEGPLDIPQRARAIISRVARQGVALDTALHQLLRERQQAIATDATWIAGSFAAAALAFGVLSLLAFGLIHRRIGGPVHELATTIDRIRAGESDLRAASGGDSELARLADTLNRLLDERDASDRRIAHQQQALEDRERMLTDSQRIARVGSWRLDTREERLEWSDETFRIAGIDPAAGEPTPEGFLAMLHAEDREHLRDIQARAHYEDTRHDRADIPLGALDRRDGEIADQEPA